MVPRASPRRYFVYLVVGAILFLLILNVRQWKSFGNNNKRYSFQYFIFRTTIIPSDPVFEYITTDKSNDTPWYMSEGVRLPQYATRSKRTGRRLARLFPFEDPKSDRITNQLMFVPPDYKRYSAKAKRILVFNGLPFWNTKLGREPFIGCPVDTCSLSLNREDAAYADLIIFENYMEIPNAARPSYQRWMIYYLESPFHTDTSNYYNLINWTATYRRDSDIVTPYERWQYYTKPPPVVKRNFAANKTRQVAWFVSNCGACNGRRDILPIVMGARPEDYAKVAPPRSYIHVDEYATPLALASYLRQLDADDELYNSYFKWKGSGEFINTYFWCRVCALLHDDDAPHGSYSDFNEWWRGKDICTK